MCILQPTFTLPLHASAWKCMQLLAPHLQAVQQGQSARHLPLCCPPQHAQMSLKQEWASDSGTPLQCISQSAEIQARKLVCVLETHEFEVTWGNVLLP